MLQKLTIKNYAIIDNLVVTPEKGLNIVTGETGAGKSIILGALSLILGERADTSVLINKEEKCIVEAVFDVGGNKEFHKVLAAEELDDEEQCIIRREINTTGKSRAFVNDTPVKLNVLNSLTSLLVDLHRQFDHLAMDDNHFQMDVLDAVAGNSALRKEYREQYKSYKAVAATLAELESRQGTWQKEADYKQFLLDELQEASLSENEIEEAEQELKKLNNAERITEVLQESVFSLNEGEQPIVNQLKRILQRLQEVDEIMPGIAELNKRINSVHIELEDITGELETLAGDVVIDEEQIQQLQDKVDIGYKLLKKHGVQTTNELLSIQGSLEEELQQSLNIEEEIAATKQRQQKLLKEVLETGNRLSASRSKEGKVFAGEVNKLLTLVGMPNALFSVNVEQLKEPAAFGLDRIQFYLDANKSGRALPVHKAASGGEMSRIMLCIKSLTAKAMHLPTLIFDEVDTGVSGEAAKQVGILLRGLSQYHQVICITHQPQVAARGNNHLYVYKEAEAGGRINTRLKALSEDERILAVAKMIGGEQPGEAALQNARELMTT